MEYYSAIKKNEICPIATTWMELEGIMLSEISQRKTNIQLHSYVEFKIQNIKEGKQNHIKTGRETNHKRLLNTENKLKVVVRVLGGGLRTCWESTGCYM